MVIALRIKLIANSPLTSIQTSACVEDASTFACVARYLHGDPDNVIAFAMVYCCAHTILREAVSKAPQPQPPESLRGQGKAPVEARAPPGALRIRGAQIEPLF